MSVTGSPQELAATRAQLRALYNHAPGIVLSGSMGRAAIYGSYNYAEAPELPLRDPNPKVSQYRDLDVLFPPHTIYGGMKTAHLWYPHVLDVGLSSFVRRNGDGSMSIAAELGNYQAERVPVDPAVFEPVAREFLGVSVLTLAVGTQLQMERVVPRSSDPAEKAKYAASHAAFAAFAETIRPAHPEEFLPDAMYAPFDEVVATRIAEL